MWLNGRWRHGAGEGVVEDRDPYANDVLVEIPVANESDLHEAFRAAADAQPGWAATLPRERSAIIRRAAERMEARHDEIIDWLVRESGARGSRRRSSGSTPMR